ncbi:hypothetical protein L6232_15615 [Shewanella sp. C31]|nr:hypothetical protein [Shewanella electrica]
MSRFRQLFRSNVCSLFCNVACFGAAWLKRRDTFDAAPLWLIFRLTFDDFHLGLIHLLLFASRILRFL